MQNMEGHNHPDGVIVLRVYVHCQACGNLVLKCLRGFDGVEGIEIDAKNQRVIVKGAKADPIKVAERLRKKSGKHVELLHPQPLQQEEDNKKKVETPEVIEVILKIKMHCEGCAKEVKHCIHSMEGVETVDVDKKKNMVRVKGTMDPQKLVELINKRGGRCAEIVKQSPNENGGEGESCNYCYDSSGVHAPQFFSDENPSSCSVM